jgi:DNA (cytosine-5)-methyltransferase 1
MIANELIVDNFAGGGGASTGLELGIGRHVDIAINHDQDAIDMHKMNHPNATHYCESVWDVDPIKAVNGQKVGLAWFSPDCKHFSKAKGGKPVEKHVRGLAWVAVRWAVLTDLRMLMLENVEEFMTWGPIDEFGKPIKDRKGETFHAFVDALSTGLDRHHPAMLDIAEALGDHFNVDQIEQGLGYSIDWRVLHACDYGTPTIRKRLFLVARNDGKKIKFPIKTHGEGLLPYRSAADIIDWNVPVRSIFNRKRPLAENTMKRIAKGLERYVFTPDAPFIVPAECAAPFITEHANGSNQRNMPLDEPLRTLCAQVKGGHFALVSSHMIKLRGTNVGSPTTEPVHTISAGGLHIGEVRAFLVKYYGTGGAVSCEKPLDTVTTKDRFGLVTVQGEEYQIVDIGMRMLEPHELFAAMGFPDDYKISHDTHGNKLSKAKQVARCGNAVCPPIAKALVQSNLGIH